MIVVAPQITTILNVLQGFPSETLANWKSFFRKFGLHSWNYKDKLNKLKCLLDTLDLVHTKLPLTSEKDSLNRTAGFG